MIKFLIKIWPAFIPIIIYFLWIKLAKKSPKKTDFIEAQYKVVNENKSEESPKKSQFSLDNGHFIIVLYLTFIIAILTLVMTALK
jgi:uncharacterized ion transporter superfamily protein YfcC